MPFVYPETSHVRRHGPKGYASYQEYRPWVRDEFAFRCVYCLKRERWGILRRSFELDHFAPQSKHASAALEYDNLVYACGACNSAKQNLDIPDPCECLLKETVFVRSDGSIHATDLAAIMLINLLDLDAPDYREFRRLTIGILQLAQRHDAVLFRDLMSYPDDLPDLAPLRPPKNSRPEGIEQSYFARRNRGELPEVY